MRNTNLFLIMVVALLARVPFILTYPLGNDEGHFLYDSWLITQGETPFLDYTARSLPLLYALLPVINFHSLILARILISCFLILSAIPLYHLVKRINSSVALSAVAVFLLNPYTIINSIHITYTTLTLLLTLTSMYYLDKNRVWLAGILFYLSILNMEYTLYLLPVMLLLIYYKRKSLYVFLGTLIICYTLTPSEVFTNSVTIDSLKWTAYIPDIQQIWARLSGLYLLISRYPFLTLAPLLYFTKYIKSKDLNRPIILTGALGLTLTSLVFFQTIVVGNTITFDIDHPGAVDISSHLTRISAIIFITLITMMCYITLKPKIPNQKIIRHYIRWYLMGVAVMLIYPKFHTYYFMLATPAVAVLVAVSLKNASNKLFKFMCLLYAISWVMVLTYPISPEMMPLTTVYEIHDMVEGSEGEFLSAPIHAYLNGNRIVYDLSHPFLYMKNSTLAPTEQELITYTQKHPPRYVISDPYMRSMMGETLSKINSICVIIV